MATSRKQLVTAFGAFGVILGMIGLTAASNLSSMAQRLGYGVGGTLLGIGVVGFGFWAISFTMSRESQRLERRLGVGQR